MARQKTTNDTKASKISEHTTVRIRKRGRPTSTLSTISSIIDLTLITKKVMSKYHITYDTFITFILVYSNWVEYGIGLNCYQACKMLDTKGTNDRMVLQRLQNLLSKGLIDVIGNGKWNCNLYAPSVSAVNLMKNISKVLLANSNNK